MMLNDDKLNEVKKELFKMRNNLAAMGVSVEPINNAANIIDQLEERIKAQLNALGVAGKVIEQLDLDSTRWNAFINSPFRLFGYAGLDHEEPNRPCQELGKDGYAHFGCEMWTKHSGWKPGDGKNILIGFADQAIVAANGKKG